jgi:hypothetical protein
MNRDDLRLMENSLLNFSQALGRNAEAIINVANIANQLELIRNDTQAIRIESRDTRNMIQNLSDNVDALTHEVRVNERNSIGRVINSHNLNAACEIFWLPVCIFVEYSATFLNY